MYMALSLRDAIDFSYRMGISNRGHLAATEYYRVLQSKIPLILLAKRHILLDDTPANEAYSVFKAVPSQLVFAVR